jgi:hypothetical protein
MAKCYVRIRQELNGFHLVHKCCCPSLPDEGNRILLGNKSDGHHAMAEAKKYYSNVNGCLFCNKESYDSKPGKMNDLVNLFFMSLN